MAAIRVVRAADFGIPASTTPGMDRREAIDEDGVWAGTLRTAEGVTTGWHTHPGRDTYMYVVSGSLVLEFGPAGRERVEAQAGDFVLIPRGVVHREGTTAGSNGVEAVLVRIGEGEIVANVDGPDLGTNRQARDRRTAPGHRARRPAIPAALTPARTGIAAFAMRGGMISSKNGTGSPHSSWRGPIGQLPLPTMSAPPSSRRNAALAQVHASRRRNATDVHT